MTRFKVRYQTAQREEEHICSYTVFADDTSEAIEMCKILNDDVASIVSCVAEPN